jgi:hypothetical protein
VLPGLLLTEWGLEYGEEKIGALKEAAALGKEVCSSLLFLSYCVVGRLILMFRLVVVVFELREEC